MEPSRPAIDEAQKNTALTQNRDLRQHTKQVKRHASRLGADYISETNSSLRLIIRRTASVDRTD